MSLQKPHLLLQRTAPPLAKDCSLNPCLCSGSMQLFPMYNTMKYFLFIKKKQFQRYSDRGTTETEEDTERWRGRTGRECVAVDGSCWDREAMWRSLSVSICLVILGWDVSSLWNITTSMFSDPQKLNYISYSPYPRLLETNTLCYSKIWRVLKIRVMFISCGAGQYPLMKLFNSGKNIWIFSISEIYKDYKILISIQVYILPQMSSGCVT